MRLSRNSNKARKSVWRDDSIVMIKRGKLLRAALSAFCSGEKEAETTSHKNVGINLIYLYIPGWSSTLLISLWIIINYIIPGWRSGEKRPSSHWLQPVPSSPQAWGLQQKTLDAAEKSHLFTVQSLKAKDKNFWFIWKVPHIYL